MNELQQHCAPTMVSVIQQHVWLRNEHTRVLLWARSAHYGVQGREEGMRRLKLKVLDPPLRQHIVYSGAAILGEVMAGYDDGWTTKAAYQEDPKRAIQTAIADLPGAC
jgi:actin-related protein